MQRNPAGNVRARPEKSAPEKEQWKKKRAGSVPHLSIDANAILNRGKNSEEAGLRQKKLAPFPHTLLRLADSSRFPVSPQAAQGLLPDTRPGNAGNAGLVKHRGILFRLRPTQL